MSEKQDRDLTGAEADVKIDADVKARPEEESDRQDRIRSGVGARLLRLVWGLIPWVLLGGIVFGAVSLAGQIQQEQARITEAKKAAIKKEAPATRVVLLEMTPRLILDRIELPATVEADEDLTVKAEVTGQVVKIMVKEGQFVKKGQMLVQLDDRDYQSRLERVKANYRYAQNEYRRMSALARKKVTAQSTVENIEAQLKDLWAQVKAAQLALDRTTIIAPFSGRLNELKAKQGDILAPMSPVATILRIGRVKVTVGVPESDVAAVFDLKKADITIDALNKRRVTGKKIYLSRQPATMARLYNMELAVNNKDGRILPGMFARVDLVKRRLENALIIPLYAAISQNDQHFVFVAQEDVAEKRPVKLGIMDGWQVQVEEGLEPGEKVVVVGQRSLEDGQRIEALKTVTDVSEIFGQ